MSEDISQRARLAHSIADVATLLGISRSTIYREIAAGNLKARKLGCRTIILDQELDRWLQSAQEVV